MKSFSLIAAVCKTAKKEVEGGLGVLNDLPWPMIKEDMKFFKELTSNSQVKKAVIMGRNTYNTIPNNFLKNRINIVLTSNKNLIQNINTNINKILMFLSSFCLLLSIISIGLINNSIRLSIYSKRFVIQTMSLVGAENWQIQKPFLIKSLIQGMYSSIFAIFLLIGSIQLIQKETASILNVNDFKLISFI